MSTVSFRGVSKVFPGGARAVEALDLDVEEGELLVLLGPSGCGKTTVLRLLAGLEVPTGGEIWVGPRRIDALPAAERDIAMVFQSYALYPHKTVRRNLEFPLRMRGAPKDARARQVAKVAELLDLTPLLDRRPGQLSGGQQQRVAIGRALVREPSVFLMDEPLSNLDAQLRTRIRSELASLQRELGITTLFVTHDQVEAMTLGHRVAVLRAGRLQQVGTPDELYRRPANVFVARFVGQPRMNLVAATFVESEDGARLRPGGSNLALPLPSGATLPEPTTPGPYQLGWRPEALRLTDAGVADLLCTGRVTVVENLGPERLVHVQTELAAPADLGEASETATLIVRTAADGDAPAEGSHVGVAADAEDAHLFGPDGGAVWPAPR